MTTRSVKAAEAAVGYWDDEGAGDNHCPCPFEPSWSVECPRLKFEYTDPIKGWDRYSCRGRCGRVQWIGPVRREILLGQLDVDENHNWTKKDRAP
jgi:hypothetical protein